MTYVIYNLLIICIGHHGQTQVMLKATVDEKEKHAEIIELLHAKSTFAAFFNHLVLNQKVFEIIIITKTFPLTFSFVIRLVLNLLCLCSQS